MSDEKFNLNFNLVFNNTLIINFKKNYESFVTGYVVKQYLTIEIKEKIPNFTVDRIEHIDECNNNKVELSDFYFFNSNQDITVHLIKVSL